MAPIPSGQTGKLCVTLMPPDTRAAIVQMAQAVQWCDCIELRLDAMSEVNLPDLLAARPCPVVLTNRPRREGGLAPDDDEPARIRPLLKAVELGADFVDFELDAAKAVPADHGQSRILVSRHDFQKTPADLPALWRQMNDAGADVCKIAASGDLADCLTVLELLAAATRPTIAICMGAAGLASRVMARRFPATCLTYAALANHQIGGPGQLTARVMRNVYRAHRLDAATAVYGLMAPDATDSPLTRPMNDLLRGGDRNAVFVPLNWRADPEPLLERLAALGFWGLLIDARLPGGLPAGRHGGRLLTRRDGAWQAAALPDDAEAQMAAAVAAWRDTQPNISHNNAEYPAIMP